MQLNDNIAAKKIVVHSCAHSHLARPYGNETRNAIATEAAVSKRKKSVLFANMAKVHKSRCILLVFMPNRRINQQRKRSMRIIG